MSGHGGGHEDTVLAKGAVQPRNRRGRYQRHGLYSLKRGVATLGSRGLPTRRTSLGRALQEWRAALVADLGGEDAVTTAQHALVDLAVRSKLMLDSVDSFILGMESLVNKRRRMLYHVVRERQSLADSLAKYLGQLGLERRESDAADVNRVLEAMHGKREAPPHVSTGGRPKCRRVSP